MRGQARTREERLVELQLTLEQACPRTPEPLSPYAPSPHTANSQAFKPKSQTLKFTHALEQAKPSE